MRRRINSSAARPQQRDFWPELASKSMVMYARLAGASAPARSSEDGRARTAEGALGNPALNPDSFGGRHA